MSAIALIVSRARSIPDIKDLLKNSARGSDGIFECSYRMAVTPRCCDASLQRKELLLAAKLAGSL